MEQWTTDWPVTVAWLFLLVVGFLRGGATYWVGRGARAGSQRWRGHDPGQIGRIETALRRWGSPVVALSFLTVGVQTLVNLTAGAVRMPLRAYLSGLLVGAALWATLYITVGVAAAYTALGDADSRWVGAAVVALGLSLAGTLVVRRRLRDPDSSRQMG